MSELQDDLEQIREGILSTGSQSFDPIDDALAALARVAAVVLSGDETQNKERESASALEVEEGDVLRDILDVCTARSQPFTDARKLALIYRLATDALVRLSSARGRMAAPESLPVPPPGSPEGEQSEQDLGDEQGSSCGGGKP